MTPQEITKMMDSVKAFFDKEDRRLDLEVLKFLRLRYPYQNTTLIELERDLVMEAKKHDG